MIFTETKLKGAFVIDLERHEDERGFFARAWCKTEFAGYGLNSNLQQCNLAVSKKRGTLRGLHYQVAPYEEAKLVWCTRAAIYDVIVDLRPDSNTYMHWIAVELAEENYRMLYVPKGFAHGYQTLFDNTEVFYYVSQPYRKEAERGLIWNDPAFGIIWPEIDVRTISKKDQSWPHYPSEPGRMSGAARNRPN
jgi:dTDP-4-dehydrorhamnose 3,5-epimerase